MPRWLPERSRDEVLAEVAAKRRFMGSAEHGPAALPDTSFRVPGAYKRPQSTWPAFTYLPPPAVIDMRNWTFETYGLVNNPIALTYDQIKALPTITSVEDHACFDQIATPGHGFEGVDFRAIIELTQPDDDCQWLLFECDGGLTNSVSIYHPMMLVFRRDGEPIDPMHGYPLRLWMPGEWGYRNSKWLRRVKFCERREPDFWQTWFKQKGLDDEGIANGYDSHMASPLDLDAIEGANKRMYIELMREIRHDPRGPRAMGFWNYRAPVYLGDDTWSPDTYDVTY
jgi:DMSO/TMAO reductase YedYZ molybdopterin-dependent catalytic subunit